MIESFQNLIKNIKIPSIKNKGINVLSLEEGDNPLGYYGIINYLLLMIITNGAQIEEEISFLPKKTYITILLKNINDDPNTFLSISSTGEENSWEQITGFKKLKEVSPTYLNFLKENLLPENCEDYLYTSYIDFESYNQVYFKLNLSGNISSPVRITDNSIFITNTVEGGVPLNLIKNTNEEDFIYNDKNIPSISDVYLLTDSKNPNSLIKISETGESWVNVERFQSIKDEPIVGFDNLTLYDAFMIMLLEINLPDTSEDSINEYKNYLNFYKFIGFIPQTEQLLISTISFKNWNKAFIAFEPLKTENNPQGTTKELTVVQPNSINYLPNEILIADKLNFIESNLQRISSNSYTPRIWKDNDIVTLKDINKIEDAAEKYSLNYIKQTWKENDEISFEKMNHILKSFQYNVGDIVVKDGIEAICIYKSNYMQDWGSYLFVDKNHDISYYLEGSDFVDEYDESHSCVNLEAQYGYKWRNDISQTHLSSQEIGAGLFNTNSLIDLVSETESENWPVLWHKVKEFRSTHSNDWFVPSLDELRLIDNRYKSYNNINNLSLNNGNTYWSSSETEDNMAHGVWAYAYYLGSNMASPFNALNKSVKARARLCFYL